MQKEALDQILTKKREFMLPQFRWNFIVAE
jgi:hypothetical protein